MISANYQDLVIPQKLMNKNWKKALDWLKKEYWKALPVGKTEIDGSLVYATVSVYNTMKPEEARYESHRNYADIHILIEGLEINDVCDR
jgi:YhcH/YjgK/YiaL family protein